MTLDNDKIREKIQKLLNLANDPAAFQGEIDNAMRFARRLMLEHNIKESDLGQKQERYKSAEDEIYARQNAFTFGRDMSRWEGSLSQVICKLVGTVSCYRNIKVKFDKVKDDGTPDLDTHGRPRKVTAITFYGPAADVADAVELFQEWVRIIVSLSRIKYGSWVRLDARSYNEGFVAGLWESVTKAVAEEKREAEAAGSSRALVVLTANQLMEAKKAYATKWLAKENGIRLKSSRQHANRGDNPEAFENGRVDGRKANITHARAQRIGG